MTGPEHDVYDVQSVGWALHALEPDEEDAFAAHLATCARCEQQVRESEQVLGELAYDVPLVDPPPGLLDRIRLATGTAEQERPAPSAAPAPVVAPTPLVRRARTVRWAAPAIAAGIVLIALLGWNVALRNQAHEAQRVAADRQRIITQLAGSERLAVLRGNGSQRTVGYVLQRGSVMQIAAAGLAPNDRTKATYVLWATRGSGAPPRAVGTFDVVRDTFDIRPVDAPLAPTGATEFAVSREAGRTAPAQPTEVIAAGVVQS